MQESNEVISIHRPLQRVMKLNFLVCPGLLGQLALVFEARTTLFTRVSGGKTMKKKKNVLLDCQFS